MRNIFVDMQISIQNIKAVKAKAVLKLQKENVFVSNTSIRQFLVTPRHQSSGWISDKHGDWWVVSDGVFVLKIIWEFFEEKGGSGVGGRSEEVGQWLRWDGCVVHWLLSSLSSVAVGFVLILLVKYILKFILGQIPEPSSSCHWFLRSCYWRSNFSEKPLLDKCDIYITVNTTPN